jgi:hypothetical protein
MNFLIARRRFCFLRLCRFFRAFSFMPILLMRREKPAGCLGMGVPLSYGLVTHAGLESCVAVRKFSHEALKKERAGMVTSLVKLRPGTDAIRRAGRQHQAFRTGETRKARAHSKTNCIYESNPRENPAMLRRQSRFASRSHGPFYITRMK